MTKEEAQENLNQYLHDLAWEPFRRNMRRQPQPEYEYERRSVEEVYGPRRPLPLPIPKEDPWESMFELD